ncbi:MAG: response regulator [Alphaproteobacteria bacterium]
MDEVIAKIIDILLIEDSDTDAELCIRAMRKHNLANKMVRVSDGAAALDFLFGPTANPLPDLILLDLRLPLVSGLKVLERIKTDERTRLIPVVVLTSSREDVDVNDSYRMGANSFISKPVNFDAFVDVVSKLGYYWMAVNTPPNNL